MNNLWITLAAINGAAAGVGAMAHDVPLIILGLLMFEYCMYQYKPEEK